MKTFVLIVLAGAVAASAQVDDHGANARYRMKMGRDLPAVERAKSQTKAVNSRAVRLCCDMRECTMRPAEPHGRVTHSYAEERFRTKTGRYTPAEEARVASNPAPEVLQTSSQRVAHSDTEERFRAKTGRYSVLEERREQSAKLVAAAQCSLMGCCKRGG